MERVGQMQLARLGHSGGCTAAQKNRVGTTRPGPTLGRVQRGYNFESEEPDRPTHSSPDSMKRGSYNTALPM